MFKTNRILSSFLLLSLTALTGITSAYAALTTTTANTIQGTAPYLSATPIGHINAGTDFELLGIKFDSTAYFTTTDINNGLIAAGGASFGGLTPITLAQKLGDGSTGMMSAAYKTPVTNVDAQDNDGFNSTSLTGSATVGWYYMNGATETLLSGTNLFKTFCALATIGVSPYLKITGPVTLTTPYSDPNIQSYDISNTSSPLHITNGGAGKNPIRRFYPSGGAMICYASPNLSYASGNYDPNQPSKFNSNYGFLP